VCDERAPSIVDRHRIPHTNARARGASGATARVEHGERAE